MSAFIVIKCKEQRHVTQFWAISKARDISYVRVFGITCRIFLGLFLCGLLTLSVQ